MAIINCDDLVPFSYKLLMCSLVTCLVLSRVPADGIRHRAGHQRQHQDLQRLRLLHTGIQLSELCAGGILRSAVTFFLGID